MRVAIYDEGPKGFAFYCERSELSSAFNDPDFAIYRMAPRGPFDHRLYRLRNRDWKRVWFSPRYAGSENTLFNALSELHHRLCRP